MIYEYTYKHIKIYKHIFLYTVLLNTMTTIAHIRRIKVNPDGYVHDMREKKYPVRNEVEFYQIIFSRYLMKDYQQLLQIILEDNFAEHHLIALEIRNKFLECISVADYLRDINFFKGTMPSIPICFFLVHLIDYLRHPHTPLEVEKEINNYRITEGSFLNHSVITPTETVIHRSKFLNYDRRKAFLLFLVSSCPVLTDVLNSNFPNLPEEEKERICELRKVFIKKNGDKLRLSKYTVFYSPDSSFRRCINSYL